MSCTCPPRRHRCPPLRSPPAFLAALSISLGPFPSAITIDVSFLLRLTMMPSSPSLASSSVLLFFLLLLLCPASNYVESLTITNGADEEESSGGSDCGWKLPPVVRKEERWPLVATQNGDISVVEISSGTRGPYHIQFFTLEPHSLFLPVLLHADMVFYVHTGSGKLSWVDEEGKKLKRANLRKGDVNRLEPGSIFFFQSYLDPAREKLRIYAIFSNNPDEGIYEPAIGTYSSIRELVLGFDKKLLQSAFQVPEEVVAEMTSAMKPPAIVHAVTTEKRSVFWEFEARLLKTFAGGTDSSLYDVSGSENKHSKCFNILHADPDFKNCNGWSLTVGKGDLKTLKGSNIGIFMVNLTKGSMMGPHWNPMATEIAIVLEGQGMVRIVCSNSSKNDSANCKTIFKVKEGDVFAVPRFCPMAQMSFNNGSFVFMGFSTATKKNHPQFLVGKRSVLRTLDESILAASFNVTNTTIAKLLTPQKDAIIVECTSCAEEEERIMEEEIEREKQEEEAKKREEERKKREEEEEKKREEEEAKKREEEEARKKEEEARKRQEEEERKREEERKKEEEEARKREEEAARKREEEEAKKRQEEREGEEEEAGQREEERKREEEESRKREEEAAREKSEEEEAKRREEEAKRKQQEEKRRKEEQAQREQEEARKQQQEREKKRREQQEKAEEQEGEERERQEEERREKEEARRQEEQKEKKEKEQEEEESPQEEQRRREEEEQAEQEQARRQEQERQRQREQEKEATRKERGGEGGGREEA